MISQCSSMNLSPVHFGHFSWVEFNYRLARNCCEKILGTNTLIYECILRCFLLTLKMCPKVIAAVKLCSNRHKLTAGFPSHADHKGQIIYFEATTSDAALMVPV